MVELHPDGEMVRVVLLLRSMSFQISSNRVSFAQQIRGSERRLNILTIRGPENLSCASRILDRKNFTRT